MSALILTPHAQDKRWGLEGYYDFKSKVASAVTSYRIHTFHDVLSNKGFDLDFKGFAGINSQTQKPLAGLALTCTRPIAKELDLILGLAARIESNRPISGGLYAGVSIKF